MARAFVRFISLQRNSAPSPSHFSSSPSYAASPVLYPPQEADPPPAPPAAAAAGAAVPEWLPPSLPRILRNLLKQCQSITHLHQIHAQLITSRFSRNSFFASRLLNLSLKFEVLRYTLLIYQGIDFPDNVCANNVIKAYANSSVPQQGVIFYLGLRQKGFRPNSFTFPCLFSCCAKSGSGELGRLFHVQVIKIGVDGLVPVGNSLIHMYTCCGLIEIGMRFFNEMSERDVVTWNSMVDGFVKVGDLRSAHNLFDKMPERNVVSWNVMITGYLEINSPGCALKLFREMMKIGFAGNDTTVVCVLRACARSARLKEGMSIHGYLVRNSWDLSLIINTAMVDLYSKCQKVEIARKIFDGMVIKNLVCWNAMILGYCMHGKPEDGLDLFARMVGKTRADDADADADADAVLDGRVFFPDEITFVGVLCACVRAGLLTKGKAYFHQMIDVFAIKPNFAHYWCMGNLLASHGLTQQALETVRKMKECESSSSSSVSSEALLWASLLGSCRFQQDVSLGEQVARSLIELEPQNIMCYALLLNIHAVAGRWEDVARVKEMVKEKVAGQRVPGCSLIDLIEIVHKFKVGQCKREGMQIVMMMAQMAQRENSSNPIPPEFYFPPKDSSKLELDKQQLRLRKCSVMAYKLSETLYDYVTRFEFRSHSEGKGK